MSSSTALLPKKKKDHPIFMRICHSSWSFINQKALVSIRTTIATYFLFSFIAIINYELKINKHGWLTVFEFPNISYLMQLIYHILAAVWSFMHLHYPHHASQPRSFTTRLQMVLSPPRQDSETKNRDWFSMFYVAANAFPLVVAFIYWALLVPKGEATIPGDQIFGHGRYREFFVLSRNAINVLLVILEILFLNGHVRSLPLGDHPKRITWHIVGLAVLSWTYIAWAYFGHHLTGKYPYYFLDYNKNGSDYTTVAVLVFALLGEISFLLGWLLTAVKETLTEKKEKNSGYSPLPQ